MQTKTITGFRLAPQQKRLWNLQQNSSAFYSQASILIAGNLQIEILQNAIEQIVHHHQILRTKFYCLPGAKTPVMVVTDKISYDWEYRDLSNSLQADISAIAQELFWEARQVSQAEPLYLYLIKLSNQQHILIISLPALCADIRTTKNLVSQISQAYAQCCQSQKLSKEYVQYVQFSEWQNQLLEDENVAEAQEYWQQQKVISLSALKLPQELPGKQQQFVTDSYKLVIHGEFFDKIARFAQKYEITPDVILLTCWQTLIWRLTGESEIVIGTASDRRDYEELHNVLGLLATWLPIKTKFTTNLNFIEVLIAVAETLENAAEWQDYFVPEPVESNNAIAFPIGFEFVNITESKSEGKEVTFALQDIYSFIEPCKVKLTCLQCHDSLLAEFYYDLNCFSQETIQRLAKNFQTLLINIIDNPETPISQLGILSTSERQQLLVEFNRTKANYQHEKCFHQLFEEQVEKTPNQIAVVFNDEEITYQELNCKANQLARYLQNLGVKSEVVVGICVERNPKFIISLLAVLKAGGAYLPLDAKLPYEALQFRLQNAQASVLIKEEGTENSEQFLNITEVNLDSDWEQITQESTENLINNIKLENLVYVIYTSGSTGKPKGVAVEHQQLLNYLYGILPKLQLLSNASYASVSTFAADLGNTMIFPCLSSGGCLHIISWERASDPTALATYFRHHPIDCLKIVPSHLAALLSSELWEILPHQLLILGGEAADWNLIENIQKNASHCRILNHYGPTETTVGVLTYLVGEKIPETATVPIGKPIANTQIYVLDANLQPVPLGVTGELYIGGESLVRGYLNQPELKLESFITNPFTGDEQRLYKTGDRVRYLDDGNLEFLGRLDEQVKIRGYRIELGEIATALSQHPAVRESVVIVREETSKEKRLIAYIVPTSHSVSDNDFRNFLQTKLPEYMIPAAFVILKALPLTANGKLDRNALPAPEEVVSTTFIAPRTLVEEVLTGIWAQFLDVSKISINDNFFDLGGHSLLATQVISRIRTTFAVEIPLPQLFESANLATLAEQIEIAMRGEQQKIQTIKSVPRNQNLPLSFAQQRLWFFDQFEPGSPSYNLPRAVRLQGKLNINALSASLNEIIKRHEILRTSFAISYGQPIQVISPAIDLQLPIVDLQNIPPQQREAELYRLAKAEAQTGFDLTQAPLLRAKLLQLDVEDHVILMTLHHIVSDGWSTDILIREVAALYTAFCAVRPSPLPQLPIQYADFAVWQRQWLEGETLKKQLAYWQQQLSGELPILQLPTDRPRPTVQTYAGKTLSFVLPKTLSDELRTLSQQEGVTLFMTLLAAFKTLLYRYTNQTDILVGSPIANRNRAEIENLIGFFVNTLVLRSNLSGNPTFRDLLKQVRKVALGAYAHQDLPFEKLVEAIQPERNLSHNPLFQVMFVFQNVPRSTFELPDLSLSVLNVNSGTASFDLCLTMEESEQGLTGNLEYNTDLFDAERMNRLVGHFQTLLEGIIKNREQCLSDLPLLTSHEQHQLLEWGKNQALGEYLQPGLCIHQLFEAQVEKTPNAVAVVFENQQLTYQELNQKANQLAHYLQKLGVKAEVLVGLYVERSLEMVVGLLAILKAGGAYLPLDPAYPQERIAFMLTDAQVPLVLTQQKLIADLPVNSAQIICLDNFIIKESTDNIATKVSPENLAYVIYTSGSTGQSKGVMIQHQSLTNAYLAWEAAYQLQTSTSSHLQMASFSFDVFTGDLVRALCSGGKLVLCPRDLLLEPEKLYNLMLQEKIDCAEFVPAVLRNLILYLEKNHKCLDFMKLIICGSDSWYGQEYEKFRQFCGSSTRLINSFGVTEATIDSTYFETQTIDLSVEQLVPIGSPFTNTQIYILDSYFQPVPVGIIGEIYIGGVGIARGYLQRPDLTAEKFIPNLFSQKSGDIFYKTGDLGRYLGHGQIELVGRIDNQVKIRGFRIELGEIESVLNQHPEVQANVVIVRDDKPGDAFGNGFTERRLVAYVVSKSKPDINNSALRSFLQDKLPNYMLPTAFVILDKLPLTPNGKVDRKALPVPDTNTGWETSYVPPRTPIEQIIADIWADVLGQEEVGIYDNFFELGGHSLLATQVISRLRTAFKIDLPLRSLFENPRLTNIVGRIEEILTVQQLQAVPVQMEEDREEIEL